MSKSSVRVSASCTKVSARRCSRSIAVPFNRSAFGVLQGLRRGPVVFSSNLIRRARAAAAYLLRRADGRRRRPVSGSALWLGHSELDADQLGGLVNLSPVSGWLIGQPLRPGSGCAGSGQCFRLGLGEDQQVGEYATVHRTRRIPMGQRDANADRSAPEPRTARVPSPSATGCTPAVGASAPLRGSAPGRAGSSGH